MLFLIISIHLMSTIIDYKKTEISKLDNAVLKQNVENSVKQKIKSLKRSYLSFFNKKKNLSTST